MGGGLQLVGYDKNTKNNLLNLIQSSSSLFPVFWKKNSTTTVTQNVHTDDISGVFVHW